MRFSAYIPRTSQILASLCQTPKMKVNLVQVWQQKAARTKSISVNHCCQLIGLSPSSYYAITGRQASPPKIDALPLALKAAFMDSGQTYGSRRLLRVLNKQGFTVGRFACAA